MKKHLLGLLIILALGSFVPKAEAAIHLTVNTTTEELRFSGSATGGAAELLFMFFVYWGGESGVPGTGLDVAAAFHTNYGPMVRENYLTIGHNYLELKLMPSEGFVTITAVEGYSISYAHLAEEYRQALEQYCAAERSMPSATTEHEWAPITTSVETVPEPSTWALLGLAAVAGGAAWFRRARRVN